MVAVIYPTARWKMDLFPGNPPNVALQPEAWSVTEESVTFAILGDNGTGGRNAMDIARQMALTYEETPYGLVVLLGDISYYGSIADRYEEVFFEPLGPLLDAGVSPSTQLCGARSRSSSSTPAHLRSQGPQGPSRSPGCAVPWRRRPRRGKWRRCITPRTPRAGTGPTSRCGRRSSHYSSSTGSISC